MVTVSNRHAIRDRVIAELRRHPEGSYVNDLPNAIGTPEAIPAAITLAAEGILFARGRVVSLYPLPRSQKCQ